MLAGNYIEKEEVSLERRKDKLGFVLTCHRITKEKLFKNDYFKDRLKQTAMVSYEWP